MPHVGKNIFEKMINDQPSDIIVFTDVRENQKRCANVEEETDWKQGSKRGIIIDRPEILIFEVIIRERTGSGRENASAL